MKDKILHYKDFLPHLEQAYTETISALRNAAPQDELARIDEQFRALLAEAAEQEQRDAVRAVIDKLVLASDEAFRQGGGRRGSWTLTDLGHLWEGFSELGEDILRLEPDGARRDDLAYASTDPTRKSYLLAFLNAEGDPVPRRLSEIAERVAEPGASPPKLNAVYNRLVRLAQRRLVKRAGPYPGLYELTRWGYEVAHTLQAENAADALSAYKDGDVLAFLGSFVDDRANAKAVKRSAIRERLRSESPSLHTDAAVDKLLSTFLTNPLIRRVVPYQDEYELTPLGWRLYRDVRRISDQVSKSPSDINPAPKDPQRPGLNAKNFSEDDAAHPNVILGPWLNNNQSRQEIRILRHG